MRYPRALRKGDTVGICAPSAGVSKDQYARLDNARKNIEALGFLTQETAHVRSGGHGLVSAPADVRAAEFMSLYENPDVALILPPWGGEFLMDMLPLLDFDRLLMLPPKWLSGYSDITTLTFAMTLRADIATVHGANLMNLGGAFIHPMDKALFTMLSITDSTEYSQHSAGFTGGFEHFGDITAPPYEPTQPGRWQSLYEDGAQVFSGRVIGGCLDVICKLVGTPYAPVQAFLDTYKPDGFVWALESCEMSPADIYRTLWQMRQCGWFRGAVGFLIGRPDGCKPMRGGYTCVDAMRQAFDGLGVPVLYDTDIGHIPPQIQLVNGAMADVVYAGGEATVTQRIML